jgi:uncharacterized membrane protein
LVQKKKNRQRPIAATRSAEPSPPIAAAHAKSAVRLAWIDAARGSAIVLMIVYHFCFDLSYFHILHADLNHDPLWIGFRSLIVSSFLMLVGVSLSLLAGREAVWRPFMMRELRIGACAILVSAGSYAMFPATFIYFGILHFIFFASLIAMAALRLGVPTVVLALAGALAIAAPWLCSSPVFDAPLMQWIGFMTHKPLTEDYVPVFPWIGVVLLGTVAGRIVVARLSKTTGASAMGAAWVDRIPPVKGIAWMGRHSLLIYMLHQPIMLGALTLLLGKPGA